MRFTSSARKSLALFLSVVLFRSANGVPLAIADFPAEPCILLKVSASSIPAEAAKQKLGRVQTYLEKGLRVRWVPTGPADDAGKEPGESFPVADGKALQEIADALGEAIGHMNRMEMKEAAERLSDAERLARSFRFGEPLRPYLAEVFLRRGLLSLWEGEEANAVEMLARSRVLRPEFAPDPAIFSPVFLKAWKRSGDRPPPQAELLVNSLPSGATIYLDGREAGTTPGRVRVSASGPVQIQVVAKGYQPSGKAGQWLPGDSESLDFPLVPERNAALADALSSSPDGKETGPMLSRMMVKSGARRAALLLLEEGEKGPVLRVISLVQGEDVPALLGTVAWPEGNEGDAQVAASAVEMLKTAGWPSHPETETAGAPWFRKWWFWTLLGVAAVGVAVGAGGGGGGGSSGTSTGTIGVDF